MATRIARPYLFHGRSSVVPWLSVLRGQLSHVSLPEQPVLTHGLAVGPSAGLSTHVSPATGLAQQAAALEKRGSDVQLRWMVSKALGAPFGPFTVWFRRGTDKPAPVDVQVVDVTDHLGIWLPDVAATVLVDCQPIDTSRAVGLSGTYFGGGLLESVGATAVAAPASGRVTLVLRTSGAQYLELFNATDPKVQVVWLQDAIDGADWKPLEVVGLPADDPWNGTGYDTSPQGLVSAPTDPVSAALDRLKRGGPPTGYAPLTATGRVVDPPWRAPDPDLLVKEVVATLLPRIERIYRPTLTPADQAALVDTPPVDPPSSGSTTSDVDTSASLSPLALLLLPASADPFLALATGFGTAYPAAALANRSIAAQGGGAEFLVTAPYPDTPEGTGPVEMALYLPDPRQHVATAAPAGLTTARSGILAPTTIDAPWHESVRVQWDRLLPSAAMSLPTSAVVARYDSAPSTAQVLQEERAAGDRRPLVIVPDSPLESSPLFHRASMVDADQEIPLGSGGRHVGYAVAVQDVFGVWSPWSDEPWDGTEPGPPGAHVVSVALTSTFAGSTTCPATLVVEVAVDWDTRTPTSVSIASVFFPSATSHGPAPSGTDPVSPAPAGAFRRDVVLPFVGDELTGPSDVTIVHLDDTGTDKVDPGPDQGTHARRYRLTIPVATLDFSGTPRWGVKLWARSALAVVADAGWQPDPAPVPPAVEHPALAYVASPVPVPPILPPPPPGVPMGSTPDDRNRSHARIHWSVPSGAALDATGGCIVWECAETALRTRAGLPVRAPDGTLPGVRLQQLWDAYDAMDATEQRAAFRRLLVLPGPARDADVALPAGTTDIHLFTVTTQTATHVDSDWPTDSPPHLVLQAVAAPRLRRPGAPIVRSVIGAGGTVTLSLSADSDVPVASFLLYRTRSPEAAMRVETMGPAFASVPATGPGPTPDPASGLDLYTGSWSGAFDPSWDDWSVRAVAVPVDTVPVEAVRGLPSRASDVVTVRLRPTTPPDLAPLASDVWGGGHDGVLVTTSTSAPARALPDGVFRVSASVSAAQPTGDPVHVAPAELGSVVAGAVTVAGGPPAGATSDVLVRVGTRTAGRLPLAVWFTRPVAADPVDVTVRLMDPLGGQTTQTITVPGWVAAPPPTLTILGVTKLVGRVVVRLASDAPVDASRPVTMTIVVTSKPVIGPLPLPVDRGLHLGAGAADLGATAHGDVSEAVREAVRARTPAQPAAREAVARPDLGELLGGPGRGLGPGLGLPRRTTFTTRLDQIPTVAFPSTAPIQVVRVGHVKPPEYDVVVRIATPFGFAVTLDAADGGHAQASQAVT